MKKWKSTLIVVLIIQSTCVQGQDNLFPVKGTLNLKFVPASMFNPEFSSIDFAASYYLSDNYAVEIKYGKKIGLLSYAAEETKFDGYKIFADVQRIVSRKVAIAVELGFCTNVEAKELRYYTIAEEPVSDQYITNKKRWSVAPKFIFALNRRGRFLVEGFGGFGIKRVHKSVAGLEFDESAGDRDRNEYESLIGGGPGYNTYWKTDIRVSFGLNFCWLAKMN